MIAGQRYGYALLWAVIVGTIMKIVLVEGVGGWLAGTGLDAWVVQREVADPISYVSLWLSDAGEDEATAARRGAEWLEWFEANGIVAIGMGSITARAPLDGEHREPDVVIEEITGAGEEVTGPEAKAFLDRRDYLRATSDDALLAARLKTAPVFLDAQSLPSDEGWQEIGASVRRPGGPGAGPHMPRSSPCAS